MMAQKQYPRSIPVGVVDPVSGNIIPLKLSPSGSLMVDLSEIETVQLNIPPGQEIPVTVGNAEAIPTKFLTPQEVKNAAGNPVEVSVANSTPIGVEVENASPIQTTIENASPIEMEITYPFGLGSETWKPRRGTATIAISGTTSDTQVGYGKDLLRIKIPAEFTGTAIAVEVASASDETPAGIKTDNKIVVSIPIEAGDKGLWIGMDAFAAVLRGLSYFRLVSNDTEVAARAILYELG